MESKLTYLYYKIIHHIYPALTAGLCYAQQVPSDSHKTECQEEAGHPPLTSRSEICTVLMSNCKMVHGSERQSSGFKM
jgi:hypothetical protein